ncbi:MAG: YdgA family protein [Sulfuricaulis sp.]
MNPKRIVPAVATSAFGLLLLAALALPYWLGREAEKNYHAILDQLSRGNWLLFTGKNYQRGWFSSTAETIVHQPDIPFEIVARHRISHGPFPWDRILEGDWRLVPVQARISSEVFVAEAQTGKPLAFPPLTADTTFQLNGDGVVHVEMPPVKQTTARNQTIDWRGLSGDLTFDREWKKFLLDVRMPALSITAPEQQANMGLSGLRLHSDMHEGVAGYFFGEGALTVDQIDFGGGAGHVVLRGLEISSSARPAADNVNMALRYKLDDILSAQGHLGPGELVIEVRQLDAASLVKFKNAIDTLSRAKLPPPQAALILAGKGLTLLGELSKKNPELEITRLSFKTPDGEISGKGKFVLNGRQRDIAHNPMQLLSALSGRFEMSFPEPVLKRMLTPTIRRDIETFRQSGALSPGDLAQLDPQAMAGIVDRVFPQYLARNEFTRLLVKDKDVYKLEVSFRQGQLLINGQPWHMPARVALSP